MIGIILALLSAVAAGFSVVVVRRNSLGSNAFNMSLIITLVGMLILWPLAFLMMGQETINVAGLVLFGLSGFLSPGIPSANTGRAPTATMAPVEATNELGGVTYGALLAV